jgi:glyoxylase-like metal-dependent hydrolase (beta-lactamase superfamily II)
VSDHKLHVLDFGSMTFERQHVVFMGGTEIVTVPIPGALIVHPEGNILYDSGFTPEVCEGGPLPEGLEGTFKPNVTKENIAAEQVRLAGYDPSSVRYVIQTHLHFDHVGGIGQFPEAEYLVHKDDWDYAHDADWPIEFAYPLGDIDKPGVNWTQLELVEEELHDVYGDGRIRLLVSPGHSPGQISLISKLDGMKVLLTGDAANEQLHYDSEALNFYLDLPAAVRSVKRLNRLEKEEEIDLVLFGHDMEQFESVRHGADAYE